ncbi:hypothetical protein T459_24148 [Capsicum annuum]|uniref:Pectin acetylesterase n=1 Tax=Capsicum annuum TaxID=4072 RepID=A0A2G2YUG0_CAPAN|nr:hypothetical protein T459_24148 [Capsicum annuum]
MNLVDSKVGLTYFVDLGMNLADLEMRFVDLRMCFEDLGMDSKMGSVGLRTNFMDVRSLRYFLSFLDDGQRMGFCALSIGFPTILRLSSESEAAIGCSQQVPVHELACGLSGPYVPFCFQVCLDGSPPAYYFDPGFGDGVDNWIVQISCLYSQNIQQDIKTPLFIFMSAYDKIEIKYTFGDHMTPLVDAGKCSASQNQSLQEMRSEFLNALPKGDNPKLRGVFVDSVHHHNSLLKRWIPEIAIKVNGQLHTEAFADWYFDRKYTYLIDETNELPLENNARLIWAVDNATARVIYTATL